MKIDFRLPGGGEVHIEKKPISEDNFLLLVLVFVMVSAFIILSTAG